MNERLFQVDAVCSDTDEYFTPRWVFDTLGLAFDLDVCSPADVSMSSVPARHRFTLADDGLSSPWEGRVWMNPPYSDISPWWARFREHRDGVALLPCAKSVWFNEVLANADGIAFDRDTDGMKFRRPDKPPMKIWFPVMFAAFGQESVDALHNLGPVLRRLTG